MLPTSWGSNPRPSGLHPIAPPRPAQRYMYTLFLISLCREYLIWVFAGRTVCWYVFSLWGSDISSIVLCDFDLQNLKRHTLNRHCRCIGCVPWSVALFLFCCEPAPIIVLVIVLHYCFKQCWLNYSILWEYSHTAELDSCRQVKYLGALPFIWTGRILETPFTFSCRSTSDHLIQEGHYDDDLPLWLIILKWRNVCTADVWLRDMKQLPTAKFS